MLDKLTDAELTEKAKKARRNYMRKYRQRPGYKEKNAEYQKRYWARRALRESANEK